MASGDADALVVAKVAGKVISSYRVLAGHVVGLKALNGGLTVRAGRYLLLLGGTRSSYYGAFGYYGIYRLVGKDARQMCAYGGPKLPRGGVASTHKLIELLRSALRT